MIYIHHTAKAEDVIASRQQLCVILHPNEIDGNVSISGNRGRVSEALWINRKSKQLTPLNTKYPYVRVVQYHEGLHCTLKTCTIIVRLKEQHLTE